MSILSAILQRLQPQTSWVFLLPLVGYAIFAVEAVIARPNPTWALFLFFWALVAVLIAWWLTKGNANELLDRIEPYAAKIAVGMIVIAAGLLAAVSVWQSQFFSISVHAEDTAYYSQVLWNTLQGNFLAGNVQQERLYNPPVSTDLALHISPVLFAFLPIYALFPDSLTLLILRDVALAAAAWPLFQLTRQLAGGVAGIAAIALYLTNPTIIAQGTEAFYLLQFAPLAFFYALRAFVQERLRSFWLWIGIALGIREDIAIAVSGFGVWAILQRRSSRWLLAGLVAPVLWWAVATLVIQPAFGRQGNSTFEVALAGGSQHASDAYLILLTRPWWIIESLSNGGLEYLYRMLRPVAFLSVLGPEGLLATPSLVANLFLSRVLYSGDDSLSRFALLPVCAFIGAAVLIGNRFASILPAQRRALIIIGLLLLPSVNIVDGIKDAVQERLALYTVRNDTTALWEAISHIPAMVSVAAPNYMLPVLAQRPKLFYVTYLDMYPSAHPEYILLDLQIDRVTVNPQLREQYMALVDRLQRSTVYTSIWRQGDYLLLHHNRMPQSTRRELFVP